jgi:maleate cis-trans isomerase
MSETRIYGYRARIGYTSPPMLTEVFPYEFYKVAPPGVTLVVTTLTVLEMNSGELDQSREISLRVAREMARGGVSVMVLGGVPINLSQGFEAAEEMRRKTEAECGIPVTTSLLSQMNGLKAVGARKVGLAQPFSEDHVPMYEYLQRFDFEVVGAKSAGYEAIDLGRIPGEVSIRMARELAREHPELDTIYYPCPHWAVVENIEQIEQETGKSVVTSGQAIFWEAFRRADIGDRIPGYGRLLREH